MVRGCPKAYHPACIKRDEEFFSSNAKWFCGTFPLLHELKRTYYLLYAAGYQLFFYFGFQFIHGSFRQQSGMNTENSFSCPYQFGIEFQLFLLRDFRFNRAEQIWRLHTINSNQFRIEMQLLLFIRFSPNVILHRISEL